MQPQGQTKVESVVSVENDVGIDTSALAIHAANQASARTAAKLVHKVMPYHDAVDEEPLEKRKIDTNADDVAPGLTKSNMLTLEEMVVTETKLSNGPQNVDDDTTESHPTPVVNSVTSMSDSVVQAGSSDRYAQSPATPYSAVTLDDTSPQEERAREAKSILRKHLASKFGDRVSTVPIPAVPRDPKIFEDPISDKFWHDIWVAAAVHNVSKL